MSAARILRLVILIHLSIYLGGNGSSAQAECAYERFTSEDNPVTPQSIGCYSQPPESSRTFTGWAYGCDSGNKLYATQAATIYKTCDPRLHAIVCDGCINPASYYCGDPSCEASNSPPPQTLPPGPNDGPPPCYDKPPRVDDPPEKDTGCRNDENKCAASDRDPFPVRFSTGRVESQPFTAFTVPGTHGLFFGYTLQYNSSFQRANAVAVGNEIEPQLHMTNQDLHFVAAGWLDNYQQRLVISVSTAFFAARWEQASGTVMFGSAMTSDGKKYRLVDRGTTAAGGRWAVQTSDTTQPLEFWLFEESPILANHFARLKRHALATSATDFVGYYGYTVNYNNDGTIHDATDTLGRSLMFSYSETAREKIVLPAPALPLPRIVTSRTLQSVSYKNAIGAAAIPVVTLTSVGNLLERITLADVTGYRRYRYFAAPSSCFNCKNLLTDVISPGEQANFSPGEFAPTQSSEVTTEHHDFEPRLDAQRPRAIGSSGVGRKFGYSYFNQPLGANFQFDLGQDQGPCLANNTCASTSASCRTTVMGGDNHCYTTAIRRSDLVLALNTMTETATSTGYAAGVATQATLTSTKVYEPERGNIKAVVDEAGIRTTYGSDSLGRTRCLVRGDNDEEAFADPPNFDASSCAGPATAQVVAVNYGGSSQSKTTPSLIGGIGAQTTNNTTLNSMGLPTQVTSTGYTRDITGAVTLQTHTSTTTYDALGRTTGTNGPMPDATHYDVSTVVYYNTGDASLAAFPHNLGNIKSVSHYVGTATTNTARTTTYSEYDRFGVPHRIVNPNGVTTTYSSTTDRLTWTITILSAANVALNTSMVVLNTNGTVRAAVDGDNICTTFEYSDATGFVGAPTKIKRTNTSSGICALLPINGTTGEVEIRTYVAGEADRLASIKRYQNGVEQFSYSGFSYGPDRKVVAASTLDSAQPFTFQYTDVLPSGATAPTGPSAGAWKTQTGADDFARPAFLYRFLGSTNKQHYNFAYASPFTPRPTTMTRGLNGAVASTTTFVYDDFGRLVQTVTPETGTTNFAYDLAGNLTAKRIGVGTALVRTSQYTYDSLGRVLFVDNDTENPVVCATATGPEPTPISDEEYTYDTAPAGFTAAGWSCGTTNSQVGQISSATAVVQCTGGASSTTVKRARLYCYDGIGRLASVSFSTVTGGVAGAVAKMPFFYSAGSRMTSYGGPSNSNLQTGTVLDPSSGRPSQLRVSVTAPPFLLLFVYPLASNLTYRAFGPLTGFDTPISQPVTSGNTRKLTMRATYRADDALQSLSWQGVPATGTPPTVSYLVQIYGYGPAGAMVSRFDTGAQTSRFYQYDALMRLTCEARGDSAGVQPTYADCTTSSARLVAQHTYNDGASALAPPDTRASSFTNHIAGAGPYQSTATETYTYAGAGSGRVTTISRGAGNDLVLGYDALGRRSFDYDSIDPTRSRRDYTYLPNGQLGKIVARSAGGAAYNTTIRYDHAGLPVTVSSGNDSYELFWDDQSRLIDMVVTKQPIINTGIFTVRWHYHYLGASLLAATREVEQGTYDTSGAYQKVWTVKRFWVIADERGLPHRMLDEQGAEYWRATWDAAGWRTISTQAADMQVWFGLPGQLLLPYTDAYTSGLVGGVTKTWYRAPIAINQWRAYDALTGMYLQPDDADRIGRTDPEGYAYARSSPTTATDRTGASSIARSLWPWPFRIDDSCDGIREEMIAALNQAISDVMKCTSLNCGSGGGAQNFKRQWVFALMTGNTYCASPGHPVTLPSGGDPIEVWGADAPKSSWVGTLRRNGQGEQAFTRPGRSDFLQHRNTVVGATFQKSCLARVLAHEAAHGVFGTLPYEQFVSSSVFNSRQYFAKYNQATSLGRELPDNYGREDHHGNIAGRSSPDQQRASDPQPLQECVSCK